jgi:CheY-like chemotaxis protein
VLGGEATIHALAGMNPDVRIIAASGLASEEEAARQASPAVRAFIQKPYTADHILKALQTVLHPKP